MPDKLNKQAMYISGAVHLAFFLLIGLTVLVKLFSKPPQDTAFVFEMVESPNIPTAAPAIEQSPEPAIITPEVPKFEVRVRHSIEMPETPAPRPAPPAPVVPKQPVPKPKPLTKPKPAPVVKPMTLEQFRQQHGKPKPRVAPRPAIQKNIDVPSVAVPTFESSPPRSPRPPRNHASSQALDAAYKAKLKHHANLAWDRPQINNSRALEAKILYTIAPNGTIESVRFEQRSGNAVLDNSAIAAARLTKSPGPTPTGKREIIRIRFIIE